MCFSFAFALPEAVVPALRSRSRADLLTEVAFCVYWFVTYCSTNADGSFTYTTIHSTLTINPDGSFTYTPDVGFTGSDTFTYRVSDGLNDSAAASFTIAVNNDEPPTADTGAAYSYTIQPGATLTTTSDDGVLSNAFDPYGYSLTAEPDPSDDGGGTANADGSFTYTTANSTLTVNPDGSFTYTPNAGFTGTETFTYLVSDGLSAPATGTFTIDVTSSASGSGDGSDGSDDSGDDDSDTGDTNDSSGDVTDPAPVAEDDSYTIAPNQTLLTPIGQGVLAVDSDPEGNTLTAVLESNVTHGTLSLQSDGLFEYTPSANFVGDDAFIYQASDGTYMSDPVTVSLTVTSDAPGGTDDGGVAFSGPGLAASGGYGGVSGTGGATSPNTIVAPDSFDPTLNGPGLTAPGVYAAGLHDTASQAATLLTAATAAAVTASFHGEPVESDLSSINGGSPAYPSGSPYVPNTSGNGPAVGVNIDWSFFGEAASGVLPYDAPGYQSTNGSYPVGNQWRGFRDALLRFHHMVVEYHRQRRVHFRELRVPSTPPTTAAWTSWSRRPGS